MSAGTFKWSMERHRQMVRRGTAFAQARPTGGEITYRQHFGDEMYPTWTPQTAGCVVAYDGDQPVGYLRWYGDRGRADERGLDWMIEQVTVTREFRRRGIATRLLREAQKIEPRVRHSRVRTEEGDVWAKATGDEVPVRCSWEGRWYAWRFKSITDDIKHKILNESGW